MLRLNGKHKKNYGYYHKNYNGWSILGYLLILKRNTLNYAASDHVRDGHSQL